ncbi:hypothetical protein ABGF48_03310 [Helcococcus bovis]|uniref:hypothetical protein n=1 Tax=Helcococcus bovis TaxID=3153252 RepID=UPI0038BA876D
MNKEKIRELMYQSHGKRINLYLKNGEVKNDIFINCYHQDEGEDEPAMLEIGKSMVTIDEIEKIEILN